MSRPPRRKLKSTPHLRWDANFPDDPMVRAAGEQAAWLFLCMACECRRRRNDGLLAGHLVARLGVSGWRARLDRLIDVGLVEQVADGYLLHGYRNWNLCEWDYQHYRHAGRVGGCASKHAQPCQQVDCMESRAWLAEHPLEHPLEH